MTERKTSVTGSNIEPTPTGAAAAKVLGDADAATRALPEEGSYRSRTAFAVVWATLALLMVGPNLPTPLYPLYRETFGFSALTITAIYALYAGALIPSLLLFGPLSDAIGRRRVLYVAVAFGILGSLVLATASGVPGLAIGRVLQGLSIGAASGAATASLRESEPTDNRARAATLAAAAMVGGSAGGPLLAGVLAQYYPAPRVLSYAVHIALLVMVGFGLRFVREAPRNGSWTPQRPGVPASIRGLFAASGASAFLVWAVTALFLALVPSFIAATLHTSNVAIAGATVTLMLASSALVQLTGRSLPPWPAQIAGLLAVVVGLAILVAAGSTRSVLLLLAASVIAGLGQGLAFLGAMKEVNLAAPPDRLGEVISGFYVVVYLGVGVPVIGVGILATHMDLLTAVRGFSIVVGIACTLLAAGLAVYTRRHAGEHTPEHALA